MHPRRHSFLAYKHDIKRAIVARDIRTDGTVFTLECGHQSTMAPHFDGTLGEKRGCHSCSLEYIRTAPQYAKEWEAAP